LNRPPFSEVKNFIMNTTISTPKTSLFPNIPIAERGSVTRSISERPYALPVPDPRSGRTASHNGVMETSPAVRCREVQKHFGEGYARVHVLRGVNFEARQGKLTFLVGPSGCGKTTLISVIAGLLNATGGEVEVFGQKTGQLPAEERILFRRRNLGFVYQQYNLITSLTAAENAAVPLLAAGTKRREALHRARALLAQLGLEDRADAEPAKLSGGQQQRVALARALVHEPRLIICDEPTAALDHTTGEAVMELLACSAVQPDRAVIVVTHDTRVFHFADTIAHMDDGSITRIEHNN
jgi:putative ABC transport system ATP-binding protein